MPVVVLMTQRRPACRCVRLNCWSPWRSSSPDRPPLPWAGRRYRQAPRCL